MIKTAVVILNWNGEAMLRQFLPSVIACSRLEGTEIYVADNASTDASCEVVEKEFPSAHLIRLDKNYGFADGYNYALQKIDAEYAVLLNSDVEVTEGWLQPMVDYLDTHPETVACQPKIRAYRHRNLFEYAGARREDDIFNFLHEDDFCIGEVKVDINPVTEEQSGALSKRLIRAEEYMEQELAFAIEDRYIFAQSVDEGYDYTIYDMEGKELDGGVYDNPDISIYEAVKDIVEDLKQKPDTNGTKGAITAESKLNPLNCEEFRDEHICYQEEYGNHSWI